MECAPDAPRSELSVAIHRCRHAQLDVGTLLEWATDFDPANYNAKDAARFNSSHGHLVAEFNSSPPTRVAAFETTEFRLGTGQG